MLSGTVLVVEDEAIIAREIEASLTGLGYDVLAAVSNGEQALRVASSRIPDAALMDIRLSGTLDGVQVGEQLRKFDVPIVYLTAFSDEETLQRASLTEPSAYLVKPFAEKELHAALQLALMRAQRDRGEKQANQDLADERARLRAVIDQMPAGVLIAEAPDGKISLANQEAWHVLGRSRNHNARSGPTEWNAVHPDGSVFEPEEWPLFRAIRNAETVMGEEIMVQPPGEDPKILSFNAGPVRDAQGRTIAAAAAFLDITERKRTEEERRVFAEELKRSNDELTRFAHSASHDMREPLRTIGAFAGLLRNEHSAALSEGGQLCLTFVEESVGRLTNLIDDLLQYASIGACIKHENVNAEAALQWALANLRQLIVETRASVCSGPLPSLYADRQKITQLFQNLIENALKYRSDKPPEVRIHATRRGDNWIFSFSDNGVGIDPRFHQEIFAPLRRLNSGHDVGTGMGLAMCKGIVEQLGGRIWVSSQAESGSTFYFSIPIPDPDSPSKTDRVNTECS